MVNRINLLRWQIYLIFNILLIVFMINCSTLPRTVGKHKTFTNKTDGSNMEVVCILDHDVYCTEHYPGFLFSDGCRKCICKSDGAYCTTMECIYYQLAEINPEEFCRGVIEKNENNASTIQDNKDRNEMDDNYNSTYVYKPENKTDDELTLIDENKQNKQVNTSFDMSENYNEEGNNSKLYTDETTLNDGDDNEKMNFNESSNKRHRSTREAEESGYLPDEDNQKDKLINESMDVFDSKSHPTTSPVNTESITTIGVNQPVNVNNTRSSKEHEKNVEVSVPRSWNATMNNSQRKSRDHTNLNLSNDNEDYYSDYDNGQKLQGNNMSSLQKTLKNSTSEDKPTTDTPDEKLLLDDEGMQNDESSDKSQEEKVIEKIHPLMKHLNDAINSEKLDSLINPTENIVTKELVNVVMNNQNNTNDTSSEASIPNTKNANINENAQQPTSLYKKENVDNIKNKSTDKPDNKLSPPVITNENKDKQNQQNNSSVQDDPNSWVSREITVSSRTVKLPNEKAVKNMHDLFPEGAPALLDVEEKETHSFDDSVHGKHLPLKNPLKSVSFTSNGPEDDVVHKLDDLHRMLKEILHSVEKLKERYLSCHQQQQQQPPFRQPRIKMPFKPTKPKNKFLAF
ncbi:hypothetical protein MN116_006556 [Schistosoma mekongi]|uniref:Uncharacterized protein n=1 Tax=Schistosoma mekongi TaxID=38744 RepID=A0AAE1Z9X6_SCHME|nr:hypothetical protein MN116_006556 [Schistosoma mekongi]